MSKVIGVKVKKYDPISYYTCEDYRVAVGSHVIIQTPLGLEFAKVIMIDKDDSEKRNEASEIVRIATKQDEDKNAENLNKEEDARKVFIEKVNSFGLEMKLIGVRYLFDASKILFYFTAEGRVDFRELVKDLAAKYKVRIELRQIGVRDETKMLGGIGVCGRGLCCATVLDNFRSVSINMAKEQNISLNPTKISGACGRLMCCLEYENEGYVSANKELPRLGDLVKTEDGKGTVVSVNTLKGLVRVSLDKQGDFKKEKDEDIIKVADIREYEGKNVKILERRNVEENTDMAELKKLEDKN
ncbi:MAG: stage 0 sporulation protein [Clostridia bacterium]|nr:stage 0 sporulation protein [Clostridia bacterium]